MSDFHFLRPWWLLALVPAGVVGVWLWRAGDPARAWRGVVAPHLLPHLLDGSAARRFGPLHTLLIGWPIAILALAGPAWRREPAPFADDVSPLVIVLKVSPSMRVSDVQPTRQERAVQKVRDLLALRPGAKTALVVYYGSAHRVLPLTTDAGLVTEFAGELSPEVMPAEGDVADDALKRAAAELERAGQPGWVLWVADAAGEVGRIDAPVSVLAVAGDGTERDSLRKAAAGLRAEFVTVTPDEADVRQLAQRTRFAPATGSGDRWRDEGYWLLWPIAALALLHFRPGWAVRQGGGA